MRFSNIAAAAAAVSSVSASTSICDKYTTALLKQNTGANQYTLLTLLVNTALIGNFTGPGTKNPTLPGSMNAVPGILAPGMVSGTPVSLVKYFDGSLLSTNVNGHAMSQSFLDGGGATPIIANPTSSGKPGSNQAILLAHLYQYFGVLLGCSQYGMSGFPSYGGVTSLATVHQFMQLSDPEFTYFVMQVGLAATSFGASTADATAAGTALIKTFGYRCAPAASVIPGAPAELQAICQGATCPLSPMATCAAYPMEPVPAPVSMKATPSMGTSMAMPTGTFTMPSPTAFNAAALPTAAAGLMAAAGALAAAML